MTALRLFHTVEPYPCSGLLDDPLLLVRVRPTGRSLLFDCGQLHHLAKRTLRSIDAVFVSHAHMDHLMGFDHLVRHTHVSPRPLHVYGPPPIATRIANKLAGYDWNLAEAWWRTIFVHEVHKESTEHHRLAGADGFRAEYLGSKPRDSAVLHADPLLTVEGVLCDHGLPVLAFRLTEAEIFTIDPEALVREGLQPGAWLRELKGRWKNGELETGPLEVLRSAGRGGGTETIDDAAALYRRLRADRPAASIGYVTDIGADDGNLRRLRALLTGVSLLCCECTFLAGDEAKARASRHLCTTDVNRLVEELRPRALLPMHLSKAYIRRPFALYDELAPPAGTRLLRLPDYATPRPKLLTELPPFDPAGISR
ncbi:MAG: MBL fold metallo-hydrolase [Deltaproteobacteria bacterium]|nr:MAG: MBL fold metallo-hydrolase [Deltaproteobacteria bacterium]